MNPRIIRQARCILAVAISALLTVGTVPTAGVAESVLEPEELASTQQEESADISPSYETPASALAEQVRESAGEEATQAELYRALYGKLAPVPVRDAHVGEEGEADAAQMTLDEATSAAFAGAESTSAGVAHAFALTAAALGLSAVEVRGADGGTWNMVLVDEAWTHADASRATGESDDTWFALHDEQMAQMVENRSPWTLADGAEAPAAPMPQEQAAEPAEEPVEEPAEEPADPEGEPAEEPGEQDATNEEPAAEPADKPEGSEDKTKGKEEEKAEGEAQGKEEDSRESKAEEDSATKKDADTADKASDAKPDGGDAQDAEQKATKKTYCALYSCSDGYELVFQSAASASGLDAGYVTYWSDDSYSYGTVLTNRPWSSYASSITKVSARDTINVEYAAGMFSGMTALKSANLEKFNMSGVTSLNDMFHYCSSLRSVYISSWNVSKVRSMWHTFDGCSSLTYFDGSRWNVSSLYDMDDTFNGCSSIGSAILAGSGYTLNWLGNWNVSNVSYMRRTFKDCSSLLSLDLRGWDNRNASMGDTFTGCSSLSTVKVGENFRFGGACLPSYYIGGTNDWYSSNGNLYTPSYITAYRSGIADCYSKTWNASRESIAGATVAAVGNKAYTGGAIKPSPQVRLNGTILSKGGDYTLSYSNNTKPGKATITVKGIGNYYGSVKKTFTITKANLSKASISGVKASYSYTGKAIKPNPKVKLGKATLKKGTHYTVTYKNNKNKGTATIIIKGKGSYTGTAKKTFKISKPSVSSATVKGVKAQYTYTGGAIKPNPTVKVGKTTLKKGTHYTVKYANNKKIGKATITIVGKGKYAGTKKVTFKIVGKSISNATIIGVKAKYAYTGGAIKPNPTVKVGKTTLKKGTHYKVSYKSNTKRGTATIVVTGKGIYRGTKKKTFKIVARGISKAGVSNLKKSYNYTGFAVKPSPTVKVGKRTLKKGTDYTISYKNNVAIGKATLTITGKGNYSGKKTATFKISRGQYYQLKRDTWKYENVDRAIPLSFYQRFYGASQGSVLAEKDGYGRGGYCYGMSCSVPAIVRDSNPSVQSFAYGGTRARNLRQVDQNWISSTNGLQAVDYVAYCQISQYDNQLQYEQNYNWENYEGLVSAVRNSVRGGSPITISFFPISGVGHAVFPLSIKSDTSSATVISIYDSNFPTATQELTLKKTNGRYNKWYSYTGDLWGFYNMTWSNPVDDLDRLFRGNGNSSRWTFGVGALAADLAEPHYTLYAVSSDVTVNIGGVAYSLDDRTHAVPGLIIPIAVCGGRQGTSNMYWICDGAGEVTFTGVGEDTSITVAGRLGGVEANVEEGAEVTVGVSDFSQNSVSIEGSEGKQFEVRYFDDDGTGEQLEEVSVAGVAAGEVRTEQVEEGVEVQGVTGVSAEADGVPTGRDNLAPEKTYVVDTESSVVPQIENAA